jgi:prepilin-type N-terminal cleavage/methylation domain-containing protein
VSRSDRRRNGVVLRANGFTLIEILVATAVIAVVLSAAYGWVWSVGSLARTTDDCAQASTIAATLARAVVEDVRGAMGVTAPVDGHDPSCSVSLVRDQVDVAPDAVAIVWDPSRGVVWRNATGTYVADHVRDFRVAYVLADGRDVTGAVMTPADWDAVRMVRVTVTISIGAASVTRGVAAVVGSA